VGFVKHVPQNAGKQRGKSGSEPRKKLVEDTKAVASQLPLELELSFRLNLECHS
jgi:hypothetical protein